MTQRAMSTSPRRLLGWLLVSGSAIACMVALVFFSDWRVVGSQTSGNVSWTTGVIQLGVGWQFFLPVFLCGAVGAFCLVWASRKPPKLPR
jgi:hypothetical protein